MSFLFDWICTRKRSAFLLMLLIPAAPSALAVEPVTTAREAVLLIDVRTPQEYQAGHLKDAINIEHTQIIDGVSKLTQNKKQRIELYCRSGNRSGIAQKMLQNAGYENVINLGGFEMLLKNHVAVYPQQK